MRMRRRRAERCVLRAQLALDAGFPDDARVALDEARRLDSSTPEFEDFQAGLDIPPPVETTPRPRRSLRIAPVLGALALVALVALLTSFAVPGSGFRVQDSGSAVVNAGAPTLPVEAPPAHQVEAAAVLGRPGPHEVVASTGIPKKEEARPTVMAEPAKPVAVLKTAATVPPPQVEAAALSALPGTSVALSLPEAAPEPVRLAEPSAPVRAVEPDTVKPDARDEVRAALSKVRSGVFGAQRGGRARGVAVGERAVARTGLRRARVAAPLPRALRGLGGRPDRAGRLRGHRDVDAQDRWGHAYGNAALAFRVEERRRRMADRARRRPLIARTRTRSSPWASAAP